jgi:hypothetical protein
MKIIAKTVALVGLLTGSFISIAEANELTVSGTLLKQADGTTFDKYKFKILSTGTFTTDVAAYEASQSNTTTTGYLTHDINNDGELTWLDPDTYFYHDDGTINQSDAIFRCDDVDNNCGGTTGASNYFNGLNPTTSPLTRTTHLQSETSQDGSVHFRRDPWYDVTVNSTGDYLFLLADFRLDPAEAEGGINGFGGTPDTFAPPTNYVGGIVDHGDYQVKFSSSNLNFSLNGDTITVTSVPVPGALWLFGSALVGLVARRKVIA